MMHMQEVNTGPIVPDEETYHYLYQFLYQQCKQNNNPLCFLLNEKKLKCKIGSCIPI